MPGDIGVIPWSPLPHGFLAGNRQRGSKDATKRKTYDEFGHGLYYADSDYGVAERGITSPIIAASRLEQLDQLVEGWRSA